MSRTMPPIPSVLAFLLCDRVIDEAGTRKKTLVGIFDRIVAPPPVSLPIALYVRMTDGEGDYVFKIDIVHLDDDKKVASLKTTPQKVRDRLAIVELALNIRMVTFKASGRYEFQLYGNDIYLGHVALDVAKQEPK